MINYPGIKKSTRNRYVFDNAWTPKTHISSHTVGDIDLYKSDESIKGFVELIDHMGNDMTIVRTARVSYDKNKGTPISVTRNQKYAKSKSKQAILDKKLVTYLLEHDHGTPFEHVVFTFHVKCPIFVMRQWIRHRMASYNEISGRYTEMKDEFYIPSEFRIQGGPSKQTSVRPSQQKGRDWNIQNQSLATLSTNESYDSYQRLLRDDVAKELARIVLPLNTMTEFYWTINLRSLLNFLRLREDSHAQEEIRVYAMAIRDLITEYVPWTMQAFDGIQEADEASRQIRDLAKSKGITPRDIMNRLDIIAASVKMSGGKLG